MSFALSLAASIAAALIILGLPWGAASYWAYRRVQGLEDWLEVVGVGLSGFGATTWSLWLAASRFRLSPLVVVAVPVALAAVLCADARRAPRRAVPLRPGPWQSVLLVGGVFVALLLPTFLSFGVERAGSVQTLAMTDWYKHLTVTTEIAGTARVPPVNPYLATDSDPRYYFGFYIVAAAMSRLAGQLGDVYAALVVLTFVVACAVPLAFYAFARSFCHPREAVVAAAACLLAGFDLVVIAVDMGRSWWEMDGWPVGFAGLRALVPSTQLDYWVVHQERQFNPFYVATAWAPQHVAAVLVSVVVLRLVASSSIGRRRSLGWLPAVALAGVPALSAYVAFALAVGVVGGAAIIAVTAGRRGDRFAMLRRWGGVGAVALVLSLPILWTLWGGEGSAAGLTIRVSGSGGWSNGALWNAVFGEHWWTNLLDTPAVYAFELGMVGVVGVLCLLRRECARGRFDSVSRETLAIGASIVALVTLVRPPVGEPNNLYARPMLLVYAMLAPLAARGMTGRVSRWHRLGVGVCAGGTLYAALGLVLQGMLFYGMPGALNDACDWVTRQTARSARVAVAPEDFTRYIGFACRRPLVVADRRHARLLGASDSMYDATSLAVDRAYAAQSAADAARAFDDLGADTILRRLPSDASVPVWASQPCFAVGFRNTDWLVVTRTPTRCGDR